MVDYQVTLPPIRPLLVEPLTEMVSPRGWWFRWWLVGGLLVLVGLVVWLVPRVIHPERGVILNYLVQNLHDPEGMEVVSWSEPIPVWFHDGGFKKRGLLIGVAVRARNGLGGRRVGEHLFVIFKNRVVRSAEVGRDYQSFGGPYQWDFDAALDKLDVEVE